ncbi:MAG: DUF4404 family protein [Pseudomonadales bacterium]|nr:DUF4404 family protein [Pseudomonadales bacterium]
MSEQKLQSLVSELHSETRKLEGFDQDAEQKLKILISDMERELQSPDQVATGIQNVIAEFEITHPRVSAILEEITVLLGNMGI